MAKEQFFLPGTQELCDLIDRAGHKAGFGRGQVFEDFLALTTCCLATGLMEEEYLATVRKGYDQGEKGKRGIDYLTQAFATLIKLMEETRQDVLGDLFCGGITYNEQGQFFTPDALCSLMANLVQEPAVIDDASSTEPPDTPPKDVTVYDPCCGSGRMLLAYAEQNPRAILVGQDIDIRCVRMTGINIALRGRFGYVLWGNSLGREVKRGFQAGENMYGRFIREMRPDELSQYASAPPPRDLQKQLTPTLLDTDSAGEQAPLAAPSIEPPKSNPPGKQRNLFD